MLRFFEVCENTRKKLGRNLHESEVEFLRYTHKRYELEQKKRRQTDEKCK